MSKLNNVKKIINQIKEEIKFSDHNIGMIQDNMPAIMPNNDLTPYENIIVNLNFNLNLKEVNNAYIIIIARNEISPKFKYLWNLRNLSMWQGKKQISENYLATLNGEL